MPKIILALTGLPGSGKTTAASFFKKKGLPVVRMGEITDFFLKKKKLPKNEENEKFLRESLRQIYGEEIYAAWSLPKIEKEKFSLVVLEGLRNQAEYEYFKREGLEVKILYLQAKKTIRYQRLIKRKIRSLTFFQAQERDKDELKFFSYSWLKRKADFILKNEGSKKKFFSQLKKIYQKVANSHFYD